MNEQMKVVNRTLIEVGIEKVLFEGTYEECKQYMKINGQGQAARKYELLYENGRIASWVL